MILGMEILITSKLVRKHEWNGNQSFKFWRNQPFYKKQQGILVGKRTIYNGVNHYVGDGIISFEQKESISAFLVTTSLNTKPFYSDSIWFNPYQYPPKNWKKLLIKMRWGEQTEAYYNPDTDCLMIWSVTFKKYYPHTFTNVHWWKYKKSNDSPKR